MIIELEPSKYINVEHYINFQLNIVPGENKTTKLQICGSPINTLQPEPQILYTFPCLPTWITKDIHKQITKTFRKTMSGSNKFFSVPSFIRYYPKQPDSITGPVHLETSGATLSCHYGEFDGTRFVHRTIFADNDEYSIALNQKIKPVSDNCIRNYLSSQINYTTYIEEPEPFILYKRERPWLLRNFIPETRYNPNTFGMTWDILVDSCNNNESLYILVKDPSTGNPVGLLDEWRPALSKLSI